ncbi:MAG: transcription elongation factor GreB [Myxococcales bacterium]
MSDPNYITPVGARRLQDELTTLRTKTRPKVVQEVADAAAQGDRSENAEYIYGKKRLREIDRRMHFLVKRLEDAVVVEPRTDAPNQVFFGAWVTVEDEDGHRAEYRLVGADELDVDHGDISWRSPLGRALLKRRLDDVVVFRRPSGEVDLTIVAIRYG